MDFYFRIQEVRQGNHESKVNLAFIAEISQERKEKKKGGGPERVTLLSVT